MKFVFVIVFFLYGSYTVAVYSFKADIYSRSSNLTYNGLCGVKGNLKYNQCIIVHIVCKGLQICCVEKHVVDVAYGISKEAMCSSPTTPSTPTQHDGIRDALVQFIYTLSNLTDKLLHE